MRLFYREMGSGEPLVILHGLFGISDNWQTIAKALAEKYRLILPDLRNHGQSPHEDAFSYSLMVEDLKNLMDDLGILNFVLAGHSMGGKVAMEFACLYPEMVSKLVVIDIGPKYYPVHHQLILEAMFSLDFNTIKSRKEAEGQLASKLPDLGLRQFLLKNMYWKTPDKLGWRMNLPVIANNIEEVGKKLPSNYMFNGPSLFLSGDKSNYVKVADESDILKQFPKAEFAVVENAGHWVHAENPTGFKEALLNFIENS